MQYRVLELEDGNNDKYFRIQRRSFTWPFWHTYKEHDGYGGMFTPEFEDVSCAFYKISRIEALAKKRTRKVVRIITRGK